VRRSLLLVGIILGLVLIFPMRPFGSMPFIAKVRANLAVPNPEYTFQAHVNGWNFSQSSGTNPTIVTAFLFPGQTLTATSYTTDSLTHSLAYYQPGTPSNMVSQFDTCGPGNPCLAKVSVPSSTPVTLQFAFSSAQTFELYCQFHPLSMHAKVFLYQSPDLNGDHVVNILDLTRVGIAFGSTPTSSNWNPAADLNRDNAVNILDLVTVAINFGRTV
jgi:dockerin type I repeat protein